ncbi:MAG: hypothetical protein AB1774_08045 [Bacillota bacterium]
MAEETRMVHVRMPASLVKALDDMVKRSSRPTSRSKLVVEAVASSIQREKYLNAVKGLARMLTPEEVPHWQDEEAIDKWLSDNREVDKAAFREKWET